MREPLRWDSQAEPTALAQVVHAGWLQRLLRAEDARRFPGPGGGVGVGALARRVFEGFVELGISYVHEPADSGPGTQLLRPLDEVVSLHQATCLDMCAAFCSAALDAGVYPLILTIRKEGRRHALVLVPLERNWSRGCEPVLEAGFSSEVLTVDGAPVVQLLAAHPGDALATWLAVDVQQASTVGGSVGDWESALDRGAEYVRDWQWEVCVDVGGLCAQRRADDSLPPVVRAGEVLAQAYTELPQDFTALQLIRSRYNVVPFCPRPELAQLREWALSTAEAGSASAGSAGARTAPDLAIAVVAGAGGTGKTRLAAQLCHSLSAIGWCTGFVPSTSELTEADLEVLAELTTELLIVVDYAEEARKEQLATLLRRLRERRSPTRIVLTARGTDVWWQQFQEELVQDGIRLGRTLMIAGLGRHPDSPLLFRKAVRRFSQRLGLPAPQKLEAPAEPGTTALEVVLRAWLAVVGQVGEAEVPDSSVGREALFDRVLDVEFARWKQFPALGEVSAVQLRRAAATVSLLAPRGETGVDEVLSRLPEWAGAPRERSRFAELLTTALLRPATAGEGVYLQPDPVADHLICSEFGEDPGLLEHILPADLESDERLRQAVNACVVLTRAAGADQAVAQSLASAALHTRSQLWREALDVALTQGGPFASALDELAKSGYELPFAEIDAAIPLGHSWLRGLAVTAARRLLEAGGQEPARRAALLNNLANRLSEVGRRGEALGAAREAVGLRRVLAEQDPAAFTPDLAMSLNNLANMLSEVGRRGEALEAAREAVGLYRGLAEQNPAAYASGLAGSLSNLANMLSEVGRRGEALEVAREAVGLYRGLAEQNPAVFTPDLATSLGNLAIMLSEVGRRGEALEAAREAVDLYRGLAEQNPPPLLRAWRGR
ncbi:tetratricopeptide repeat protein [Actinomyces procaprae]|uniref:tetratricopeptide repeat protein n=1 Tax=Actinomyces procaprae TaxID=2560010 RepID=UPI0010A26659|nr:tetratricopeptide repeat protein [Actinomyces procaprae]